MLRPRKFLAISASPSNKRRVSRRYRQRMPFWWKGSRCDASATDDPTYTGCLQGRRENIIFYKRQQWVTTNYALLVYAVIFIVSARFFSRTDMARGWLGILVILTFAYHMITLRLLQDMLARFRDRLAWIYTNYFTAEEQTGLSLWPEPKPFQSQWIILAGLVAVSVIGAALTLIYLFSVR